MAAQAEKFAPGRDDKADGAAVYWYARPERKCPHYPDKNPADEIEQRRFSRSVRTHDAEDLALFNGQTDIFDRSHAAEGLGSFPYSQQGHG